MYPCKYYVYTYAWTYVRTLVICMYVCNTYMSIIYDGFNSLFLLMCMSMQMLDFNKKSKINQDHIN